MHLDLSGYWLEREDRERSRSRRHRRGMFTVAVIAAVSALIGLFWCLG